jgi:hypothetical protein
MDDPEKLGNTWQTRHRRRQTRHKYITQKTATRTSPKTGGNQGTRKEQAIPDSWDTRHVSHVINYMFDTTMRKNKTQVTYIRHEPSNKQLEVQTNWKSFLCGNRSEIIITGVLKFTFRHLISNQKYITFINSLFEF